MSAEIDEYPSLYFQDIRKKKQSVTDGHMDGRTEGRTDKVKTAKFAGGIMSLVMRKLVFGGVRQGGT